MFDTLKLIYTQDEALELVGRYEKVYNEKIKELEEEIKKLKSDLAFKNTMLDNVSAEYECLQDFIKKLKKRVKEHTTYSVKAEFMKKFWD